MFGFFKKKTDLKPSILFFCGAGLSAESGLQTFRDNGLWNNYDINEVCNIKTFHINKEKVFEFYNQRKKEILSVEPNAAHYKIAEIQKKYGVDNVHIFTSNIDNLLEKAGCQNVTYVHGNIFSMKCLSCEHIWDIGLSSYDMNDICPACGSKSIKPSVIFFNEAAPLYKKLKEYFEKTGPVIKSQITYNIKVIVGTSFKVIKPSIFMAQRGRTIIVDKNMPDLGAEANNIKEFIIEPATTGLIKAAERIEQWY